MANSTEQKERNTVQPSAGLQIIERKEASELGLKRYYTGRACKSGHVSQRKTENGICLECHRLREIKRRAKDPQRQRDAVNRYYRTPKGKTKSRESSKRYRLNPKNKSKIAKSKYRSKEKNRPLYNAISKVYARRVKKAIPTWESVQLIKNYYMRAQTLGLEVDHIVPITSDIVCGLHCLDNFQMLTREENASKGNRFWPDMP